MVTVKQHILDFLEGQDWTHKGRIEDQARNWGREVSNIDRRCRELANEGKIERRLNRKGHTEYKLTNPLQDKSLSYAGRTQPIIVPDTPFNRAVKPNADGGYQGKLFEVPAEKKVWL